MVKLLENTFRAVNIGLVNELALMCDRLGIDVWEVVDAAKTKPFGFMPFYPGPGLGGHCIPIDPFYLSWKAKQTGFEPRFIELAGQVNSSMPHAVVDKIADALNVQKKALNGSHVLVAGVSYKRDIDDIRESPSLDVMGLLHQKGVRLSYVDPFVPTLAGRAWPGGYDLTSTAIDAATLAGVDCVAILTDHREFDYDALVAGASLVVDTRNAIKQPHPHVFKLGAPHSVHAEVWQPLAAAGDQAA
jgi:UDP-N-acetyl-D-glucosamine dehydrogenase